MTSPIDMTGAQPAPRQAPKFDPYTGQPLDAEHERIEGQFLNPEQFKAEQLKASQEPIEVPQEVNPYAPTGWKSKDRSEFDVTLPSGQLCRIMRLEREDLFRMNLLQYLDTFTPMLMDQAMSSDAARDRQIKETIKEKPDSLSNMFMAIDEVVMAATVKPKITDQKEKADYGGPADWRNPRFVPVAWIHDIQMEDRLCIFGAAFGRSMDDLKSVLQQTPGMGSLADVTSVQPPAE